MPKKYSGGSREIFYFERFPIFTVSFIVAYTTEDKNAVKSDWSICTMRKMKTIRIRDYNCLKFRISKSLKIVALT